MWGADWGGRDDLAHEFTKMLGAAQEGGSTISECLLAASRMDRRDDNSWYAEWTRIADTNAARAEVALQENHTITARSNLLRALNYYLAAARPLEESDQRYKAAIASMRNCALQVLRMRRPVGQIVSLPWLSNRSLEGIFLPARGGAKPSPVLFCVGEPEERKEQYLYKVERYASERGMSFFAIDFFDRSAPSNVLRQSAADPDSAISVAMDYLCSRKDVDLDQIVILADGWSSSLVARAVGQDGRFAAAVCDAGIWDFQERAFLNRKVAASESFRSSVARALNCPVLVTVGEAGWLPSDRVRSLIDQLRLDHRDITLKVFTEDETAALQGHVDNPTLASEFIFDWISTRLGIQQESD